MSHSRRTSDRRVPIVLGTCVCGKVSYRSRKDARAWATKRATDNHRSTSGDERLNAYSCSRNPDAWHLGHLPTEVRRGVADRSSSTNLIRA